ncbi:nucleoredoxin [Pycnococcus provasolii]|uniref:Nucleoredoxin n=1 Tax=Pycnococcus provasolii TaxID=41880 RepID=A0A830HVM5_9CHLO|nr:nucleoredoxin [Pycnococcus provasolii]
MESLLGASLRSCSSGGGGSLLSTASALAGKTVGLYFSAHWCPPCRQFTPVLSSIYSQLVEIGKPFEIVFISSDKSEEQYNEYLAEMPWLAVPYAARDVKDALSKKYKVSGIPSLVLVDGDTGNTINPQARGAVASEGAEGFPWKPLEVAEALGPNLVKADGTTTALADLQARKGHFGVYFSASWCGPCRSFTPKLVEAYNKLNKNNQPFDIVLVSSDRDKKSFDEYLGHMPWHAVPFDDANFGKRTGALSEKFEVQGIPRLVILDSDLNVVRSDARGAVMKDEDCSNFPWHPPAVADVDENPEPLNEVPCLVALVEEVDEAEQKAVQDALTAIATSSSGKPKDADGRELHFFFAAEDGGIGSQIRRIAKVGKPKQGKVDLVLLDLENSQTCTGGSGTAEEVGKLAETLAASFADGSATFTSLRS